MATKRSSRPTAAALTIDPKGQSLDQINQMVASIAKLAGCPTCGRISNLRVDFVSDPPAALAKLNVISMNVR